MFWKIAKRIPLQITRWITVAFLACALVSRCQASPLHWITRLGHTNCDNHPVPLGYSSSLLERREDEPVDNALRFEAERSFPGGSTLTLVVCNGEVHVLPNPEPDKLKVLVHLGSGLGHELTPKRFLQEFSLSSGSADIEWKLPERSRPEIVVYVPTNTNLDLELGKTSLLLNGVRGNKVVNAGKGKVRLEVKDSNLEYRSIIVDIAMGSFSDLRPGGTAGNHTPLHKEFDGQGDSTAHLMMAMGKVEIAPE